ncbi:hypothetical protein BDQ17DRAFT_1173295, partial [Cyathus striatus]
GPSLPHCDHSSTKEHHTCLMLIFFLPWRNVHDLHHDFQSWSEAYSNFYISASKYIQSLINNMQILHECKDSHDD